MCLSILLQNPAESALLEAGGTKGREQDQQCKVSLFTTDAVGDDDGEEDDDLDDDDQNENDKCGATLIY